MAEKAVRLDKALRNVSGVIARPSTDAGFGVADTFNLRGFDSFPSAIYRDGAQQPGPFTGPEETAHLERVEVLKGPASILYGRIEPGGLINLVSKQPLPEPYYELGQQFGSFDLYRTILDMPAGRSPRTRPSRTGSISPMKRRILSSI